MKKVLLLAFVVCLFSCSGKTNDQQSSIEHIAEVHTETTTEETGMLPRTILGCTLGETGISQAKKILKSQGYPTRERTDDGCVALEVEKELEFAGKKWPWCMLMFFDGSLIRVELMAEGCDTTYAKKLYDLYSDNYCIRKDHDIYLNDDRTSFRYRTSEPDGDYELKDHSMTVTDFERNDLLPKGKDRMELY